MILIYKPAGITIAQAVDQYRKLHPQYNGIRLGVAGRLDPMAEGLMVVMVGEENKSQAQYMNMDKTYEVELALSLTTDSYDLLGVVADYQKDLKGEALDRLPSILKSFVGELIQAYPPYSAVRVEGKPLFWWARQNRLDEIQIPKAKRTIHDIAILDQRQVLFGKLQQLAITYIAMVNGDFRQSESILSWQKIGEQIGLQAPIQLIRIQVSCSSGTFMRGLVHEMGQLLGCGAVTTRIIRTQVGSWSLSEAEALDSF